MLYFSYEKSIDTRPLHNSGTVEKRMKNTPIKAKNETNSPLFIRIVLDTHPLRGFT